MGNFSFLKDCKNLGELETYCNDAESFALSRPDLSVISARKAIEYLLQYLYKAKISEGKEKVGEKTLFELISSPEINQFIQDPFIIETLHNIRILGNNAAHNKKVTKEEARLSLESLHFFVVEILTTLELIDTYPVFDETLLPSSARETVITEEELQPNNPSVVQLFEQGLKGKKVIEKHDIPVYFTEAATRQIYIDARLKDAGWGLVETDDTIVPCKAGTEIKVEGMPYGSGIGYCDYVLYGRDGMPLAIVESKKTIKSAREGREQVKIYGECMKKRYGYTPILYYTNGYEYWIIDGVYQDRQVSGFHNLEELDLLIKTLPNRGGLTDRFPDSNIIDRSYQIGAIQAIAETFDDKKKRKALLVMATGTGKTRVAVAIVDLLLKNGWIKNVLFLADRTALVKQARDTFSELLPNLTNCSLSADSEPDQNARLMFSTYQTMVNYIDSEKKPFGIGRFDLIIIDEAHRSIFNKYKAIFTYFDAMIIGLTATPRNEVDANSYRMLDCESGTPTFEYSYMEALNDGFLSPFYEPVTMTTQKMSMGIVYDDLSDEEKEKYEDEELYVEFDRHIKPSVINKRVMNGPTIDLVLEELMTDGLKVNEGDLLGKTIIFAANHNHAQAIVDRFNALYPDKIDYCQLIDNQVNYAQELIDKFKVSDNNFRIAVSVDMLDTGIDVPEVLNLVFFKAVESYIKFWQMIGRGTRLCKDLYGPGKDKDMFLIFDWCGLFNYFAIETNRKENKLDNATLSQKICAKKLEILRALQSDVNQSAPYNKEYYEKLKTELINMVKEFKNHTNRILVRQQLPVIDKYCNEEEWQDITLEKEREIKSCLIPLVEESKDPFLVNAFDFKMLVLEYEQICGASFDGKLPRPAIQIIKSANELLTKVTIPEVGVKVSQLRTIADDQKWKMMSLENMETLREDLRMLMRFIDSRETIMYITDFSDEAEEVELNIDYGEFMIHTYKQKILDYLNKNGDNPAITKIKTLQKLDRQDIKELEDIMWKQLGTQEDYEREAGDESLASFMRRTINLDTEAVNKKIVEYANKYNLTSQQIEFLRQIIDYVNMNGDIVAADLFEQWPFADEDFVDIFGDNINAITDLINDLHGSIAEA